MDVSHGKDAMVFAEVMRNGRWIDVETLARAPAPAYVLWDEWRGGVSRALLPRRVPLGRLAGRHGQAIAAIQEPIPKMSTGPGGTR